MRSLALVVMLGACGRIGFDPTGDATGGDGTTGPQIQAQQAYVKASNTSADADFGYVLAMSADATTLAVGAFGENGGSTGIGGNQNDHSVDNSGAVYVFTRAGATWTQQAYIKASNAQTLDNFGRAISISSDGNTLAVGALREESAATGVDGNQGDNSATDAGAAYVFVRAGTTWTQQAYLKASNTDANDRFGHSVALSANGKTLAVGALGESSAATGIDGAQASNAASGAGAVYVFERSGTIWSQQAYVKASNTDAGDQFGVSVAVSGTGDTLAVGAETEASNARGIGGNQTDNSRTDSGATYVFTRSGVTWSQQAYIKASNADTGDAFGRAIALSESGDVLAVGAYDEAGGTTGVNGNQADNSVANSGAIYVLVRAGSTWTQEAYLKASNPGDHDELGTSLALSGDGASLVACTFEESSATVGIDGNQADNSAHDAGAAYAFHRSTTWAQVAYIKASNASADDSFATWAALSRDGTWLAIGASLEDSAATGIDGDQTNNSANDSGAVYVFH